MGTIGVDSTHAAQNVTAIWILINQLSPTDRDNLLDEAGIDEQTLQILLAKMHVKNYERPMMEYTEYRISKLLLLYVPPILIILGTFGNLFSFIILRRRPMLKVSTYFYLASLAIADSLVLYIGLLRMWINELTGIDAQVMTNWLCKLTCVLGYVCSDLSVWLIIAVTVERYIVVCHPFKANQMCNVNRARKVIILLILIIFCINAHFFHSVELVKLEVEARNVVVVNCGAPEEFDVLVNQVWPWVDACIYSFFPFVLITVLNSLIIRQVLKAQGSREKLQHITDRRFMEVRRQMNEVTSKLTAMLLTVSFTFLLTTLPMNISLIVTYFWNQEYREFDQTAKFQLVKTITELLMYVNHSMNFFLYCATGRKFRHQVLKLVCHKKALQKWSSICEGPPKQSKKDMLLNHMNCNSEHLHTESEYMKTQL